ncbi:diapolycopene oxygenase [Croceivirga lutea]|uniref:1-hydroxycarotenoid 3,4-desaturase CrtD n=1 Tax=Croceivirga lutea TaxID=1775167 RepID=UPI00163982AB|nr:1-hydroxycarotenoid 3,4-desaturase CrtD [Croceivirga lutea]GGG57810.1 diapolycopene oxygenase [Croceivirga lutea]
MNLNRAIVIGSGIAGLATAIRLRKKGYETLVFEANSYPGGKLHAKISNGYRFDMGPSLFTMPHLVDELFELHGKNPRSYFNYKQKQNICNYFWEDGTVFSMASNSSQFIKEASAKFNEPSNHLESYIDNNCLKYEATSTLFLEKSLHKLSSYLSKDTLAAIVKIGKLGLFNTLNSTNAKAFNNHKLVQLFNRYATYNGSSPYKTPGIMSLIPHLEMELGTYFPNGGMHAITKSLVALAKELGVEFHFSTKVEEIIIENGSATGIKTLDKEYKAAIVVSNMDVFPTYKKLLKKEKQPNKVLKQERSSSALIFYWGIKKTFKELDLHNIFFTEDYEQEFEHIFSKKTLFKDPTVYVNISSKEETLDAPNNCENWFVMINAPGDYGQNWDELIQFARKVIVSKLTRILKTDIESLIETELLLHPAEIERRTSSYRGALYGAASNSQFAAFLRHPNFSRNIKSLYFCGGSVHPGGGIPLCLLSAKIVTDLIPHAKK